MIRPIVVHPDPILRRTSAPVAEVTAATRALVDDMLETMYDVQGRGLAAVQIGVLQRVVVLDIGWKEGDRDPLVLVNPTIAWSSDTLASRQERCLSIPDTPVDVERPERIVVRFLDRAGAPQERDAHGMLATVIQHEIDHLDGVLILDHAHEPR